MSVATMDWTAPFEALEEGLGFVTGTHLVTEAEVLAFAELTGDHHPQHVDAEWSASSAFGEQIAHGMLVISLAAGLVPFDPARVVALRAVNGLTFKRAAKFGDELHVVGKVEGTREVNADAGIVTLGWRVLNAEEQLLCRASVDVLWSTGA